MFRFKGIEGLRGWLACVVVVYHVFSATGANVSFGGLHALTKAADYAVLVFVIISGFVITHLLLTRPEPYGAYVTRRFLRIYPVYVVCLVLGIMTTYLNFETFLGAPWGAETPYLERIQRQFDNLQHGGFFPHLLAHLSLLHGAIPSDRLFESQLMFLSTAWSLSLEWQFYLLAPLVMMGLRGTWRAALTTAAAFGCFLAYRSGWFGDFVLPSFLPGAVPYFATGIATRMLIYKMPRLNAYPGTIVLIACGLCIVSNKLIPFVAWFAFIAWMLLEHPAGRLSLAIQNGVDALLDSRVAQRLGDLSYPIYLVHLPVLQAILFVCVRTFGLGMLETFAVAAVLTPALTLVAAIVLHRYVEAPFIAYGRTLFRAPSVVAPTN